MAKKKMGAYRTNKLDDFVPKGMSGTAIGGPFLDASGTPRIKVRFDNGVEVDCLAAEVRPAEHGLARELRRAANKATSAKRLS